MMIASRFLSILSSRSMRFRLVFVGKMAMIDQASLFLFFIFWFPIRIISRPTSESILVKNTLQIFTVSTKTQHYVS